MGRNRVRLILPLNQCEGQDSAVNLQKIRLYRAVRIIRSDKYCRHCTALLYGATDHAIATRIFNGDDLGMAELLNQGKQAGW